MGTPVRRSSRINKPSLKAVESAYLNKFQQSGLVLDISSDEDLALLSSDNNSDSDAEPQRYESEKPKLLHASEHVHGEDIFKFHTRKQKDSLAHKVAEACGSSTKTPQVVRQKMKKLIAEKMREDVSSGSDFQCSSSDDSADDDNSSNEEESGSDATSDEEQIDKKGQKIKLGAVQSKATPARKARGKYTIQTEDYFASSIGKSKTSNNTLDKLETPRLPQYELQKILANMKLSKEHQKSVNKLTERNNSLFEKWLYILNENFNILLFGLGSKRNVLQTFHQEYLKDLPVMVVNGFFPTLTVKNILDGIIEDMLDLKENPANVYEACDLIDEEFRKMPHSHLYLIVHNIEGDMICGGKAQNVLSRLASVPNIHLIASIDHINAPLIWDHSKLSKFNYIWWDVTSFLPYLEETSYEKSMMVQKTGTLALSSLRNVFLSLTTNSKSIYMLIVKHQLDNAKNQYYQGLSFKDLYQSCRESFIVSSDLALRAQLTEFVDHKMVKLKRSYDGTEYLQIPLVNALLQKFLDEHN